jgi:hypothetical protein
LTFAPYKRVAGHNQGHHPLSGLLSQIIALQYLLPPKYFYIKINMSVGSEARRNIHRITEDLWSDSNTKNGGYSFVKVMYMYIAYFCLRSNYI